MVSIALSFFFMPLFLFTIISLNTFSSYASIVSYTDHCASMVPNSSTPNKSKLKAFPHGQFQHGYYIGGDTVPWRQEQKKVSLEIRNVYETDVAGILNVRAWLRIQSGTWYYRVQDGNFTDANFLWNYNPFPRSITFRLDGFWSESSGKICMVGTETGGSPQPQSLEVVLRIYNFVNSSNTISALVTGSLESMNSKHEVSYFEPISVFIFPIIDYEYSLDTEETKIEFFNEAEEVPGLSINSVRFCSIISPMINGKYDLQYQSECNSAENCSPIGGDESQLPYVVSLKRLVCSNVEQRVKVFFGFGNYDSGYLFSFNPNATLVGEGWWDDRNNQLCINACHFLGMEETVASVHVGDCSTRMILKFPKIWSINDASSIVGQIWTNKTVGDLGYFKRVILRSHQDKRDRISGIKYEYTQLDKARKLCPRQEPVKNKGIKYPNVCCCCCRFHMSVEYSGKIVGWGYFVPFAVNDQIQQLNMEENSVSVPFVANDQNQIVLKSSHTQQLFSSYSSCIGLNNVSYQINFIFLSDAELGKEKSLLNSKTNATEIEINISAEGIYDAEAGSLCLLGCRNLGSQNQIPTTDSVDCEIIIKIKFQLQNAKSNIKGSIESTRKNSDPLYFNPLDLTSIESSSYFCSVFSQLISYCSFFLPIILVIPLLWPFPN